MSVTGKPRILVVDDDLFVRKPLESVLEQGGFEAMTVCRAIKGEARYAEIPVILMSARARQSDQQRGFDLGATGFVRKPYMPEELLRRVRKVLAN